MGGMFFTTSHKFLLRERLTQAHWKEIMITKHQNTKPVWARHNNDCALRCQSHGWMRQDPYYLRKRIER
ncbi:hypothetical protein DPMN_101951 [Dreissena polymorpha]|uniref:Uncharacterized protein n=1 Tax=Dreissena polymorpha TaxID=45954 RepID=A0A9D4LIE7_DREPO|nr:hypothetical protein DPMN_101951 [Dreissena polymorpha]